MDAFFQQQILQDLPPIHQELPNFGVIGARTPSPDQYLQNPEIGGDFIQDLAVQDPVVQDPAVQDPAVQDLAVQDQAVQDPAPQAPPKRTPTGKKPMQEWWLRLKIFENEAQLVANPQTHRTLFYHEFDPIAHLNSFLHARAIPPPICRDDRDVEFHSSQMDPALQREYLMDKAREIKKHADREALAQEAMWRRASRVHHIRRPKTGPNAKSSFQVPQEVEDLLQGR